MRFLISLLCLILSLLPTQLKATADIFDMGLPYFATVGEEESVPLGIITALTQDSQGLIWIGSQKGLVKFDGYQFTIYTHIPDDTDSIGGDFISALWTAPDGKIWIGTRHDGVSIYTPETDSFKRIRFEPNQANGLSDNYITAIDGDSEGNVWIGTKHGLNLVSSSTYDITQFRTKTNLAKHAINYIHNESIGEVSILKDGSVWVGTEDGIARYIESAKSFERINFITSEHSLSDKSQSNNSLSNGSLSDESLSDESLYNTVIEKIFESKQGEYWIGTQAGGVAVISQDDSIKLLKSKGELFLKSSIVFNISQPSKNEIWISTYGEGIYVFDATSHQLLRVLEHDISIPSSLNSNSIGATMVDRSGLLWIGTWGKGLNLYNPFNEAFRTLRHSPTNKDSISQADVLSVMAAQNGDIWIGTRGKGLDIVRPGVGMLQRFKQDTNDPHSLQDETISALFQTQDGTIWVGSRTTGLYRYRNESKDFVRYTTENGLSDNVIKRLLEDSEGFLWVGTGKGLDRFSPKTEEFQSFNIKDASTQNIGSHLNALALTPDGTLYAGSSNGLFRKKIGEHFLEKTMHEQQRENSLSHNMVLGLFVDSDGAVMPSTSQGLDRLISWEDEAIFESINSQLGFPNQAFWGNLQYDNKGRIWDGVSIIDINKKTRRLLTKADGVDIGVNWYAGYHKSQTNTLLYAGSKGVLLVKPERFKEWNYQPPVVITNLLVDNKKVAFNKNTTLTLSPSSKSLRIEFSALDYSAPESLQYAYRLKGYDDWNYVDAQRRSATYNNLEPDDYILQIKATNRNGVWSENEVSLSVTMLPAWYQQSWFRFLLIMTILSVMYAIYIARFRRLHAHKRVLEDQVDQRTLELEKSNLSMKMLSEIGLDFSSTLDLDKILNSIYERVNQLMDANVFWIGVYEESEQQIVFKLAIEKGEHLPQFSISMDETDRYAVWCVNNRKPIVINDFAKDRPKYFGDAPRIAPVVGDATSSIIYWPLEVAGKIIGTITVQSFEPNAYSEQHQNIIKTLASTMAIVIDNANAYEKAQHAAEVKSAFMANMSHEIRTPMNGILGMTRLIRETSLDKQQQEYISNIDTSAKALLNIINDILDFSKVESGKLDLEQKPFSLTTLIRNVSVMIETLANEKGLNFTYRILKSTPADLVGDVTRINQVLLNLCSNAVKFTPKGEVSLVVSSDLTAENKCTLKVEVIDQGIGIDENSIPKLFSSFTQADTSTTRKFGGTGLGLVISRQLAHKMDGDIKVKSIPDVGSCFTFSAILPIATSESSDYKRKLAIETPPKILVIDFDADNRSRIDKELKLFSSKTDLASTENDVRLLIDKNEYDVLFVSLEFTPNRMKSMFNLLLKKLEVNPKNIVAYTNHPYIGNWIELENYDLSQWVSNPFSALELKQSIEKAIKQTLSHTALRSEQPLQDIRIMLAEDNQINQLVAVKMLTKLGASVDVAVDGEEAVEKVKSGSYDLVLMDIQMPKMDGTKATMLIRSDDRFESLPIIAMTANVLQKDIDFYLSHGLNDHISKPVMTKDLLETIGHYVELKGH